MTAMTSEREALLPCPFCGGHAHWCMCDETGCHRIECDGCRLQLDTLENGASEAETVQDLRVIMAAAWNRRAHLTQPAQAVDGWQPTDDDVQAWRGRHNISLSLYDCRSAIEDARIMHHFDVRPAALPNANGKEG